MKFDFSDGKRTVQFGNDGTSSAEKTLKPNGKVLNVSIGTGLPNTTSESRMFEKIILIVTNQNKKLIKDGSMWKLL